MDSQNLKIEQIKLNPKNPRIIKDEKFVKLVKSIKEFPEMIEARRIVVNKDLMILGGNMRLRAMKEAGMTEIPVHIVDWPEDKQRQFIVKDNASFGEWNWEELANQYDVQELDNWGVDSYSATGADPEKEWEGMPEFSQEAQDAYKTLSIHFEKKEHVEEFEALLNQKITEKTKFIWFPEKKRRDLSDQGYITSEP